MFIGVQNFYFKLQAHRVLESSKPPKTLRSRLSTEKNTIKAGGSTARAQNVDWMDGVEWMGDTP